jgi:acyl dehydratase
VSAGFPAPRLHFEDFPVGEVVTYGRYEVTAEEIVAFAREFDPQPFHLDAEAARGTILKGLAASGWHVCAIFMRMMYDGYIAETASLGSPGIDEVKWLKPVHAGDVLACRRTTRAARISAKRPEMGLVTFHWELFDAAGERKTDIVGTSIVAVRGGP